MGNWYFLLVYVALLQNYWLDKYCTSKGLNWNLKNLGQTNSVRYSILNTILYVESILLEILFMTVNSFRIKRQAIKVIFNIKDMKLKSSFVIFRTKSKLLVLTKQVLMLFRFSSATTTTANSLIPQQRRPLVSQRPLRGCCWSSLMPLSKTNRRGKKRIFDNN